jgi:microcystin-dependent protein
MSGTPVFQITSIGLATASIALPTGPYINITSFAIGSGYGYTPLPTDTGLSGTTLFSGTPTSYQNVGGDTIDILCSIPPNAGPFQFGEIALYLPGNVMFAKAVFPTPQTKFSALGSNVVSSYELHCLLTLAQGTAIFQVTTSSPTTLLQVFNWSDIYPPSLSANPTVPLLQVMELSEYGDSTLLSNSSAGTWTIDSTYGRYSQYNDTPYFQVANASTTWIEVLATELHPQDITSVSERFVIETSSGYFRSVNSVVASGMNYRFNLNGAPLQTVPMAGSNITVYRDDLAKGTSYYSQILDPLNYDITNYAADTGTTNAYAATYKQKTPVPQVGMIRSFLVANPNTGASTFALDGGAPYPVYGMNNTPLQGEEMNGRVWVEFSATSNWILINSSMGPLQIPNALYSQQAVTLGQAQALSPPGQIIYMAASTPPTGFLVANGSAVSRTAYANLFATIGTYYGTGDGATTFNLPDLRGVVPRGWDDGRGLDTGRVFGTYQADMYMSHNHGVNDPTHNHYVNDPEHTHTMTMGSLAQSGSSTYCYVPSSLYGFPNPHTETTSPAATGIYLSAAYTGISIQYSGGNETRGKNFSLLACVKF